MIDHEALYKKVCDAIKCYPEGAVVTERLVEQKKNLEKKFPRLKEKA